MRRSALALLLACGVLAPTLAAAQNFLWVATSGANRIYLFGTLHAGRAEWYPLPPAVVNAFGESRELAVEADISDDAAMARSAGTMIYKPPDTLAAHVSKEEFTRFVALAHRYEIPEAASLQLKPFMAASLLVFSAWAHEGYLPQYGLDSYLIGMAKAEAKTLVELEGVEAQSKLLDSLTDAEARTLFASTLTAVDSGLAARQIHELVDAWIVGDPDKLLEVANKYDAKIAGAAALEEKLVWSRNPMIEARIAQWLDGPAQVRFVAVGALHLVGPRGIVAGLRKRGYTVRQVFVAPPKDLSRAP